MGLECEMGVEDIPLDIGEHKKKYLEEYLEIKIRNLQGPKMKFR